MTRREPSYELPKRVERCLAALSKLYARQGLKQQQEIIVNSQVRVHEAWSADNWNGGTYGHALYLVIPEALYLDAIQQREALQKQIRDDLNTLHSVQNEFIEEVFFEIEAVDDHDWRTESGLLLSGRRTVVPVVQERIWGDGGYRVFLSHKAEAKGQAADLKGRLNVFGVSCFVAHEDIHPTQEWQNEIEHALASMDAFVALMTDAFHDSLWTDQEVGYAFGRGIPIVSMRLGRDPYGFIGKFQALSCDSSVAAREIVKLLIKYPRMMNAYIASVRSCPSFDRANALAEILPSIEALSGDQAQGLVSAFNENHEVRGGFGFNGTKPRYYGDGLAVHLSRATGRPFEITSAGEMRALG